MYPMNPALLNPTVVGLGWGTLLGCHAQEGEHVEVCAVPVPMSRVPIAGEVTLVPR